MLTNPRLSERHASLFADDRARADYSNPRLSERHVSLIADDRAGADYLNRKAIFVQVVCANFYIIAKKKHVFTLNRNEFYSVYHGLTK